MLSALNPTTSVQLRPFNFAPGPAALPESVLAQVAKDIPEWQGCGVSVMEMSHRSKEFKQIYEQTLKDIRELLNVPENFKVLFLQGGGIGQNAIVPMNISQGRLVDFIVTGAWSQRSAAEAQKYCNAQIAADAMEEFGGYFGIPAESKWRLREKAEYIHLCSNETIHGVEFQEIPDIKALTGRDTPLVVDASSHILTHSIDWSRIGVLFAGAQKNIGPAGVTLVFVREDLMGLALDVCPTAFNYEVQGKADSMHNTPPTFAIYVAGLVFQWIKSQGGLEKMKVNAQMRSELIYKSIDESEGFYTNNVGVESRSRVNIPFFLKDEQLNATFVKKAAESGLLSIEGHKSLGGMRASVYNAMPVQGAKALSTFMNKFAKQYG